jgi:hypothetical protein
MSFKRGLMPRNVRRAMHPARSTAYSYKRKVTPRLVRKVEYARHPKGTATTWLGRSVRRFFTK